MKLQLPEKLGFFLSEHSRYKGAYGGRGGAKSHGVASALLVKGYEKQKRILCCREIQKSIRDSVKRLLDDKIATMGLGEFYRSTDTDITGLNGTEIIFAGLRSNADSIKSMEGIDIAWIEEANRASKRSLELLTPTVRKEDSEIWATWNPDQDTDPIDVLFRGENAPPDALVQEINYMDNPWFPEVLRTEMEWDKFRDPDKYAHVWLGGYNRNSEARVFKNWKIDILTPPKEARPYYGADWGYSIDPSVLVQMWIWGRTIYIDEECYRIGCEIDHIPFLFAGFGDPVINEKNKQALASARAKGFSGIPGVQNWPIRADSARPETISYLRNHGFPKIMAAKKGPGSVEDGIKFMQSYDIVIHPKCKHTIDEFTLYKYKTDKLTGEVLPILEDKKNHVIDSARYGLEGVRRGSYNIGNLS